ncbi:hypothetical protein EDC01DRAFT_656936 [Geopyxis carbonaria]|nr:hypothetical protein EDC01DRAFT_656936 [Geopyxis carbonaria]
MLKYCFVRCLGICLAVWSFAMVAACCGDRRSDSSGKGRIITTNNDDERRTDSSKHTPSNRQAHAHFPLATALQKQVNPSPHGKPTANHANSPPHRPQ